MIFPTKLYLNSATFDTYRCSWTHYLRRFFPLLLILTLLNACSAQEESEIPNNIQTLENLTTIPTDAKPEGTVQFEEELRIEEVFSGIAPPILGTGPTAAVDENGNIYLADRVEKVIRVYNPDGEHMTDIGRDGEGPGEFREISSIEIFNNRLMVYDAILIRMQTFSLNPHELTNTIVLDSQEWNGLDEVRLSRPNKIFSVSDSLFLAGVYLNNRDNRSYRGYYLLNLDGEVISEKLLEELQLQRYTGTQNTGGPAYLILPFSNKSEVQVGPDGTMYHANTDEFLIRIYSSEGVYRRAIYHEFEKDPLEEREVLEQFHPSYHSIIAGVDFPETWPVFESMIVDNENRIWISTIVDDKELYEWLVVESNGSLLARFTWPRIRQIALVKNGYVYTRETDPETRLTEVVRYSMEISVR